MQTYRVELGERSYDILIGAGVLRELGERVRDLLAPSRVAIVADDNVAAHYAPTVQAHLAAVNLTSEIITFPAGESSKSLTQLAALYDALFAAGLDRRSCVIALGGGVTGDLAGYAAATFLRGIPFVQVPTSLLAQVDSSSGGKTGVNHATGKNLIGAFHQPALVIADSETLTSLPRAELLSGIGEVVKHGVIRDANYFAEIEASTDAILALEPTAIQAVVSGSCRIKGGIVALDEREGDLRRLLNFGHTFSHAIEKASDFSLRHGEGVAIGMVAAGHLAERVLNAPTDVRERIKRVLTRLGLPVKAPGYSTEVVLALMRGDKKTQAGMLHFVLAPRIGHAEVIAVDDEEAVRNALIAVGCEYLVSVWKCGDARKFVD